jgi:hypothetical protein
MTKVSYDQAYSDHRYLWETYGPADDMTGGYVDSHDLDRLLKSPTKATARDCLVDQINYWFETGPDSMGHLPIDPDDAVLIDIADRYGYQIPD